MGNDEEAAGRDEEERGGNHAENVKQRTPKGENDEQEEGSRHDDDEGRNDATPRHPDETVGWECRPRRQHSWKPRRGESPHRAEPAGSALFFLNKLYYMYLATNPRKASPSLGKLIYFTRIYM
jgi:hypothetical protein